MPRHFGDFLQTRGSSPGVLLVPQYLPIGEAIKRTRTDLGGFGCRGVGEPDPKNSPAITVPLELARIQEKAQVSRKSIGVWTGMRVPVKQGMPFKLLRVVMHSGQSPAEPEKGRRATPTERPKCKMGRTMLPPCDPGGFTEVRRSVDVRARRRIARPRCGRRRSSLLERWCWRGRGKRSPHRRGSPGRQRR